MALKDNRSVSRRAFLRMTATGTAALASLRAAAEGVATGDEDISPVASLSFCRQPLGGRRLLSVEELAAGAGIGDPFRYRRVRHYGRPVSGLRIGPLSRGSSRL